MAKYQINYCCGHGTVIKDLVGPTKERERRIEWMEFNMLCPECFKVKLKTDKAAEPRKVCISLDLKYDNVLQIQVKGRLDESERALRRLGYHWMIPIYNGVASIRHPGPFLARDIEFRSKEEVDCMVKEAAKDLAVVGYECLAEFSQIDLFKIRKRCETIKKMSEALEADPRPPESLLRARIRELEDNARGMWNGTIYGRKGSHFFYVKKVEHAAKDAEVEEHREQERLLAAWKERNPRFC